MDKAEFLAILTDVLVQAEKEHSNDPSWLRVMLLGIHRMGLATMPRGMEVSEFTAVFNPVMERAHVACRNQVVQS